MESVVFPVVLVPLSGAQSLGWYMNPHEMRFFAALRMTIDTGSTTRSTDLKDLRVLRVFAVHINV